MFRRLKIGRCSGKFPPMKKKSKINFKKRSKKKRIKIYFFFLLIVIYISGAYIIARFDKRMLPTVLAISDNIATDKINEGINYALQEVMSRKNLNPEDFYTMSVDQQGMVNTLTVNTILVNEVCAGMAVEVYNKLYHFEPEITKIPLGSVFGIKIFSTLGPTYTIKVLPVGNAIVDFETKFESVGINQTNFQIWLNIESTVKVVNPLQDDERTVNRKVALINTVFSGKVPDTYLNNIPARKD